jgi:methylmalonyl-CoA/ethylmalonyl-CoA epimerase
MEYMLDMSNDTETRITVGVNGGTSEEREESMTVSAGQRPMDLPAPAHVGIVVKDLIQTSELYSSLFGIGPWKELVGKKYEWIVGDPESVTPALYANTGSVTIELLQPVRGESVWEDFLRLRGEGIHHLCFKVPDARWEEICSEMKDRGSTMISGGVIDDWGWAYFETKPGGLVVEILSDRSPI